MTFYNTLAPAYVTRFEMPAAFLRALDAIVPGSIGAGTTILDLCCGPGGLAAAMAARGARVTAVDVSESMIALARQRAPGVELHAADARTLDLSRRFQLVTCTYDSLNHFLESDDLRAVFRRVCAALEPDGVFVFDLNSDQGFRDRWKGSFEVEGIKFSFTYTPATKIGTCTFARSDGASESTQERCYADEEVRAWLAEAGFVDITMVDGQETLGWRESGRSFWKARVGGGA